MVDCDVVWFVICLCVFVCVVFVLISVIADVFNVRGVCMFGVLVLRLCVRVCVCLR